MAKYVPDVKTQRWIIISASRTKRPDDLNVSSKKDKPACPFCEGSESLTPPEAYRIGSGQRDTSGWRVRVVPNKFPITDIHEVIIHNPSHDTGYPYLSQEDRIAVLVACRDRYRTYQNYGHVLIFSNFGKKAGASLSHPHSQLVVIPRQINLDTLAKEPVKNIIDETENFVTYCPDFSQWPYEVWIAPLTDGTRFGDLKDEDLSVLSDILRVVLLKIEKLTRQPGHIGYSPDGSFEYNYYIYHGDNWYLRIIPRFIQRAGFELGTGLSVNVVDPTQAAEELKKKSLDKD